MGLNAAMGQNQDIAEKVEAVQALLQTKFGLRKRALPKMLRKTGRRLPRRLQARAQVLVKAQELAAHPKLARRVDHAAVSRAFEDVQTHLQSIDVADRRKGAILELAGSVAFNVLAVAGAFIIWLRWSGHI